MRLPRAWWVPAAQGEVIGRLRLHGIRFKTSSKPEALELDRIHLADLCFSLQATAASR